MDKEIFKLLDDREKRANYQNELIEAHPKLSLMVIKINYPGANKNNHLTTYVVTKIYLELTKLVHISYLEVQSTNEGLIYYCSLPIDGSIAKEIGMKLEDSYLGRLVDIDVFDINRAYSRSDYNIPPRKCFICDDIAKVCARSQKHDYNEILDYFNEIVVEDIFNKDKFSNFAIYGFINELNKSDNFGCVGINTNGSHTDMDKYTFIETIRVLAPLFNELESIDTRSFNDLRLLGQDMEKAMFDATEGINTYKGAIFTFLLLLGGLNNVLSFNEGVNEIKRLCSNLYSDFDKLKDSSAGQIIHSQTGIKGIREYAYEGYSFLFNEVLPYYQECLDDTKTYRYIISLLMDTTIIKRGSIDLLKQVQSMASDTSISNEELTNFCIKHKLSCGGSADMLAGTFLLDIIQKNFELFKQ